MVDQLLIYSSSNSVYWPSFLPIFFHILSEPVLLLCVTTLHCHAGEIQHSYDPETKTYTYQFSHIENVPTDMPWDAVNIKLAVNDITTIHAEDFLNNTECESLRIHVNKITNVERGSFQSMHKLKELYLAENKIQEVNPGKDSTINFSIDFQLCFLCWVQSHEKAIVEDP